MKHGVEFGEGVDGKTPGHFLTVGGIGAGALSIGITSLLALWNNGDLVLPAFVVTNNYLSVSRAIALGTFAIVLVYTKMWYAGNMARRLGASRIATDIAFAACLSMASYSLLLLKSPESEEFALDMFKKLNNFLVPWSLAHYIFPQLLRFTFSIRLTEGETILNRAACSFFLANHILQASLTRGVEPIPAISYMAMTMLLSSVDFQLRCNPKWGLSTAPEGVEINWANVNGVRTWSIVSFGILCCL